MLRAILLDWTSSMLLNDLHRCLPYVAQYSSATGLLDLNQAGYHNSLPNVLEDLNW